MDLEGFIPWWRTRVIYLSDQRLPKVISLNQWINWCDISTFPHLTITAVISLSKTSIKNSFRVRIALNKVGLSKIEVMEGLLLLWWVAVLGKEEQLSHPRPLLLCYAAAPAEEPGILILSSLPSRNGVWKQFVENICNETYQVSEPQKLVMRALFQWTGEQVGADTQQNQWTTVSKRQFNHMLKNKIIHIQSKNSGWGDWMLQVPISRPAWTTEQDSASSSKAVKTYPKALKRWLHW